MKSKNVIDFCNVKKIYNNKHVLLPLSFQINKNEMVGIIGPSGVGKTTILRLIAGLEKPTSGHIELHHKKIAYVFQEARLIPWKTALQNVAIPLTQSGLSKKESLKKAKHYLQLMQLGDFIDYYPGKLSGGMKQRVSLARAFAIEPDILLLDEPFSALDMKLKNTLLADLKTRLQQQPMTVLYVSHCAKELTQIVTKILQLDQNKNLQTLFKKEFAYLL